MFSPNPARSAASRTAHGRSNLTTFRRLFATASLVALAPLATAAAQVPGLTATFLPSTGPISGTTPIDVYLHLALDPSASPFVFDGNSPGTFFGLPPAIPVIGNLTTFTNAITTASISNNLCTGSGVPFCFTSSAYTFNFATSAPYYFQSMLSLAPGASLDFLFGSFSPQSGGAPSGTYTFSGAAASIIVNGFDALGNPGVDIVTLAQACAGVPLTGCEFSQQVIGVTTTSPEPATIALVATGLLGLAGLARRRRPG